MRKLSRHFYQRTHNCDVYDEPVLTYLPIVEKHLSNGNGKATGRILDAACGYNNVYLQPLLKQGSIDASQMVGMDINDDNRNRNIIHKQVVIQDLHEPIDLGQFHSIISVYTWEHLHSPTQVLENFHRSLTDGGKLIIIAPQKYNYASLIERLLPWRLKHLAWKLLKGKD
ncbi:MAG: methyltransferase domain-containing protein, partial [Planctomycetales bacterium]|nr:methyltransferase domain-containing protein [Planctomycetales bacterium]